MKNIRFSYSILFACMAICLASCKTTTKITVHGKPGEKVYVYGTKDNSGALATTVESKIKMDDSHLFTAFSFSKAPNDTSGVLIPFALDYKKRDVTILWITGILGFYPTGAIWTLIALRRGTQSAYDKRYKYLSYQRTNSDLTFTYPNITYLDPPNSQSDQQTTKPVEEQSSQISTKKLSNKSNRTLSDLAKNIVGTYFGKGTLTYKGDVIESYSRVEITISRIDNKTVSVNVIESGEPFFEQPSEYSVTKTEDGSYKLTNIKSPSAVIRIDNKKKVYYIHPNVNIEDTIYQLQIEE